MCCLSFRGASGGILAIWDLDSITKNNVIISDCFIVVEAVWVHTGLDVMFIVVYAPQGISNKRVLWDRISSLI